MTRIGKIYGEALYALAQEEVLCGQILHELTILNQAFRENPEYVRLLCSRSLSKQKRCSILDDSFRGKIRPFVLNFLKLLTEKGYVTHFSDCCKAYENLYNLASGILPVTAVTAVPLTPGQGNRLTIKLSGITGKQVRLKNTVDPAVLGGVRLDCDGKQLDDTVSHRLDAIRRALKDTVL